MQKEFTINVPDELWVDSWENNSTATYTYDGPETLYVRLRNENDICEVSGDALTPSESREFVVTVNANNYPERAKLLQEWFLGVLTEDIHENVTNPDGSVYAKITNPNLREYYSLSYFPVAADTDSELGFQLVPNYKDTKTALLVEAERRRDYVQKYLDVYDFDGDLGIAANNFMTAINNNITELTGQYPWKYINPPAVTIAKIPLSLSTALSGLSLDIGE